MSKFNLEFRIKVVTEYPDGKGSMSLAKEYGVSNDTVILGWVHRFQQRGIEGLKARPITSEYSSQFKVGVLNWKKQNRTSSEIGNCGT
ncbi:helix-turn-helix domain-containing protein [Levilactobacillus namurensis]|uniref:helix-turn-helix domain-containing protein n=1 Tax=Levilactobacillus namurensis TaxID=380393 RepID=UPI0026ED4BD7|nr:helix-turn-helix domain-containing protein [Levilactobacillus namurensis]